VSTQNSHINASIQTTLYLLHCFCDNTMLKLLKLLSIKLLQWIQSRPLKINANAPFHLHRNTDWKLNLPKTFFAELQSNFLEELQFYFISWHLHLIQVKRKGKWSEVSAKKAETHQALIKEIWYVNNTIVLISINLSSPTNFNSNGISKDDGNFWST